MSKTPYGNDAFELIRNNDARDEQIIRDVADCVQAGRTPVVLTKYVDHAKKLSERLKQYADRLILLTGANGTKARRAQAEELNKVDIRTVIFQSLIKCMPQDYAETYWRDLEEAKSAVIVSSPRLNNQKVNRLITVLGKRRELGIKVTIVTWHPDAYKYGRDDVQMELMERLRGAGFEIRLVEESCEHYAVIDNEIVWYGSVNLLSKEDAEDNLMRVCSQDIAAELLEMTFGSEVVMQEW